VAVVAACSEAKRIPACEAMTEGFVSFRALRRIVRHGLGLSICGCAFKTFV
jgi:hypothetical protein